MGAQLAGFNDQPDKKKQDTKAENDKIRFCCTEMQGWRGNMEDTHIAELDLGDGNSLFGVFDGHGG
jgi:serine/threonine protein phosphatase PrpC